MHERHASDVYRTKKDIAIRTLLKVKNPQKQSSLPAKCQILIFGRCLRNKRRFLSDKRPSHVFCELKTPDTIPNCETLVNAVRPGDSDSLIAMLALTRQKNTRKNSSPVKDAA
jgi:hypothetical protein